jgi:SAM-dependent methyltransferase
MPELCGAYQGVVDPIYLASEMQRRETARNVMRRIRQHSPNGGRLLDIGCNTGIFLDEAAKSFEVMGVELSKWAAAEASKRHAVNMVPVSHLEVTKKFDVVTLFGVIEHFDNPIQELHAIARVLKPGGLFVVYTGDVEALLPRILGKRWWWFQGMHLFYFSLRTLSLMLNRTGFDVVESDNYTVYFQLFSLGISLKRYSIGKILAPILNLPLLRNRLVGIKLSGEMLIFSRRRS